MRGKTWSKEEDEFLAEKWGTGTIKRLASRMKRTETALIVRAKRLGLGPFHAEFLTCNQAAELLGVDNKVVSQTFIKKGLKYKCRSKKETKQVKYIYLEDLITFLKENHELWDSRKMEMFALGKEYPWLVEKRKQDLLVPKNSTKKWTNLEDKTLINYYCNHNLTNKQIGEIMCRSEAGVDRRIARLKERGFLPKNIQIPWTIKEKQMLIEMDIKGLTDKTIAWELGREINHIRDYRRRLKASGEYPAKTKKDLRAEMSMIKIVNQRENGITYKELSKKLKVHTTTIRRWIIKNERKVEV